MHASAGVELTTRISRSANEIRIHRQKLLKSKLDMVHSQALDWSLSKSEFEDCKQTNQVIACRYTLANVEFLKRKGIFSYDYLDSFERLEETALLSH